ncbi:MAG TPA: ABC transporter permease [Mesotoga sp.]|nr:ABC transporter permease [Mesotoga sp.]MDI9374941.1 ABC transporter permease [Thermotogota bacterium]NLX34692.1 ABC transporter permease [Thermotogaceae bacterium]MDD4478002.1 ABC transporter permease [Mesotoga sp.]MDD5744313.1 ABC transporter permease [Mesotoga sp.]
MIRYVFKRFWISLLTLWLLATITFFLLRVLPGNPFQTDQILTVEMQERMMNYYGLNRPIFEQYFTYMGNLLRGNMGYSLKYTNRTVNSIIARAFPVSADLGLRSLALALPVGLFLGIVSARKRGKAVDYLCVVVSVIGVSIPSFILGSFLQFVFALKLKVLPMAQWTTEMHKILPTVAIALGLLATLTRIMRASMLEVTTQDYVKTAKSKGLSEGKIVWSHEIRNALIPILTMLGPMVASVLMGTFVIEKIFAIPGLGLHFVNSITGLDYTMTMGLTVFFGAFLVTANFLVDIAYGVVDPRIRIAK